MSSGDIPDSVDSKDHGVPDYMLKIPDKKVNNSKNDEKNINKVRRDSPLPLRITRDSRSIIVSFPDEENKIVSFDIYRSSKRVELFERLIDGESYDDAKSIYSQNSNISRHKIEPFLDSEGEVLKEQYREPLKEVKSMLEKGRKEIEEEIEQDAKGFKERGYDEQEFKNFMQERYGFGYDPMNDIMDEIGDYSEL